MATARKRKSSISIDDLPTEILSHHLLLKLPVVSLLQCKRVCKAWNTIVGDSEFIKRHLLHNQHNKKLLIKTSTISGDFHRHFYSVDSKGGGAANAEKLNLKFLAEDIKVYTMDIWGSSNGLLCVAVTYRKRKRYHENLLIWNPSTGDYKLIPKDTFHSYCFYSSFFFKGFAYDTFINDSTIVYVTEFNSFVANARATVSRFHIYSIKRNSWIVKDTPVGLHGDHGGGCAVNGSIYWLVSFLRRVPLVANENSHASIFAFEIKEDKFRKLQLPNDKSFDPTINVHLTGVLGERTLGIFQFNSPDNKLVMWSMEENDEWSNPMIINVSVLIYGVVTEFMWPVCYIRNGKLLLLLRNSDHPKNKMLVLYDANRNKKEEFSIRGISINARIAWGLILSSSLFNGDLGLEESREMVEDRKDLVD
ncbi:hypothetical protein LguiA_008530 [Lonicera macranthoides]